MQFKHAGKAGIDMKRENDRDSSAARRATPACVALVGAEQLNNALRFGFFGIWFARNCIRERRTV